MAVIGIIESDVQRFVNWVNLDKVGGEKTKNKIVKIFVLLMV